MRRPVTIILEQYFGLGLYLLIFLLLLKQQLLLAALLFVIKSVLYGFVAESQIAGMFNANLFSQILRFSPVPILPFTKQVYYFYQFLSGIPIKKDLRASLLDAEKINISDLGTDNNRCILYLHLSAIYYDLKNTERAQHYYQLAKQTPHKTVLDKKLAELDDAIYSGIEYQFFVF